MTARDAAEKDNRVIDALFEREKELNCLYEIEDILNDTARETDEVMAAIAAAIPAGWQYPERCRALIRLHGRAFGAPEPFETATSCRSSIVLDGVEIGTVAVAYDSAGSESEAHPFLKEELRLLRTIANRITQFIRQQLAEASLRPPQTRKARNEWRMIIDLLCKSDPSLLGRISRKMINHLIMQGIGEAKTLLRTNGRDFDSHDFVSENNAPKAFLSSGTASAFSDATFNMASEFLDDDEILKLVQRWIHEDKILLLIKPLVNVHASLTDICDGIQRYQNLKPEGIELSQAAQSSMRVALIRRFLTDQLDYIRVAKRYLTPEVFFGLVERLIFPTGSHGKLGGKSAGLFLSSHILEKHRDENPDIGEVKTPKTWHLTSEGLHEFVYYNNLEEFYEQKYKDIDEVRRDYPHIIQVFKSAHFPKEIVKGLSMALDDFGDAPLIVRSSSLLEDRLGAAFSGKYQSLFLPNRGDKKQRLGALLDAIAEVYASTFGPDPIQYRAERGLIDFNEQMAILIQEVVGKAVGPYFFPAYAGVAFSSNELRWSHRIRREDGLLRIVPGLGTRAVDRLTDDYPVLTTLCKPGLRVNVTCDEMIRYAPKKMDVINLETKCFETVPVRKILRDFGSRYPAVEQIISLHRDGLMTPPLGLLTDFENDDIHVTFDGLIARSPMLKKLRAILCTLASVLGTPVDIEFASDGDDFYLLQCRPQSRLAECRAEETPRDLPNERVLFTANRYISTGVVENIEYIVYVDPDAYRRLAAVSHLREVGRCVGYLNKILPKKRFILIGPGRWGSRGNIKLGVHVNYADINNAAMLIEMAKKRGEYLPDLSFGTHFFQDLVEASIHYLPLYPDDPAVIFNDAAFLGASNRLTDFVKSEEPLLSTVRVVAVSDLLENGTAKVIMNGDEGVAVGYVC